MKKKVISSFLVALMIAGASSISAFATIANGSIVIGSKSYDLAYANDTKNSTEITNAIIEGGAIYVKEFSGNWIDNKTGLTVNANIVPGENEGQEVTLSVASVNAIDVTKKLNDTYILPTRVTSTLSDGTTKSLAVEWNKVASTTIVGTCTFTGTLITVDGVVNTNNINVSATLTIDNDISVISDNTDITSKFTDENFRNTVYALIGKISPEPILYSDVKNLKELNVDGENSSLSGIEYFTALTDLWCTRNQLTTLDLSKNTALTNLYCYSNQLTTLDLSKNTALTILSCGDNQLTTLDVKNTALTFLNCDDNQLATFDVSNNTTLTNLSCGDNQLTTLDVSNNIALTELWCAKNQLTTLDVSNNIALTYFACYSNQLTTLDVSKNIALSDYLGCDYNQLTTLDLSKNTALTYLECQGNQLSTLDVSNNTALTDLYCEHNQLTTLDVSNNTALTYLNCDDSVITIKK
ncbi:MAG: hypothetical protein ACI8WT_004177 [Clostridium sp.]|jgi:hypothetical protein